MRQPGLFESMPDRDITGSKHGGNQESRAAFRGHDRSRIRWRVFHYIVGSGIAGATTAEVAAGLDRPMHSVSGRMSELKRDGLIVPTDRCRDGGRVCCAARKGRP
jgi:hypothetical protein